MITTPTEHLHSLWGGDAAEDRQDLNWKWRKTRPDTQQHFYGSGSCKYIPWTETNTLAEFQQGLHHKKLNNGQKIHTKMLTTIPGEQNTSITHFQ